MSFQPSILLVLTAVTAASGLLLIAGRRRHRRSPQANRGVPSSAHVAFDGSQHEARFESGLLDVDDELRGIVAHLRPLASDRLVRIDVAIQPGLAAQSDAAVFRQVLTDMVSTAINSARGGRVLLTALRHGSSVQIAASDDGQAPDHGRREAMLRPASELIALRGGRLDIDARSAEGTTVTLQLPAAAPTGSSPPVKAAEVPRRQRDPLHLG